MPAAVCWLGILLGLIGALWVLTYALLALV